MSADFSKLLTHLDEGLIAHANRDQLTGIRRARLEAGYAQLAADRLHGIDTPSQQLRANMIQRASRRSSR